LSATRSSPSRRWICSGNVSCANHSWMGLGTNTAGLTIIAASSAGCASVGGRNAQLPRRGTIRGSNSSPTVPFLQTKRSPTFVPLIARCFAQLCTPFAEDALPQSDKVAVLWIVWISKPPRELTPDNLRLVNIGRDDAEREEWHVGLIAVKRNRHGRGFAAMGLLHTWRGGRR
jgi:hypothetical protein